MSEIKDIYPFNLARDVLDNDEEVLKIYLPGVETALDTLLDRESDILRKRYRDKMTLQAIGKVYSICQERVRQIEAKALRKMRHPVRSNMMKAVPLAAVIEQEIKYQKMSVEYASLVKAFEAATAKPVLPEVISPLSELADLMQTPIDDLGLSVRTHHALRRAGKETLRDIAEMSRGELARIRNLGAKSLDEVIECLKQHGIELGSFQLKTLLAGSSSPLKEIVFTSSWGDTYAAQKTNAARAAVLCAQACRRDNSLQHVADLLQRAMDTSGSGQNVEAYLMHQRLPRSLEGLHEACKRFAQSLGFTF